MEKYKLPTTTILGIITLAELIFTGELYGSILLWMGFGFYKLLLS